MQGAATYETPLSDVAYMDNFNAIEIQDDETTRVYRTAHERLAARALSPAESRRALLRHLEDHAERSR
jgi:hypothetical protein